MYSIVVFYLLDLFNFINMINTSFLLKRAHKRREVPRKVGNRSGQEAPLGP